MRALIINGSIYNAKRKLSKIYLKIYFLHTFAYRTQLKVIILANALRHLERKVINEISLGWY